MITAALNAVIFTVLGIALAFSLGASGIALANSLAFTSQAILLLVLLNRQFAGVLKVGGTLLRVIPASLAAGLLAFGLLQLPLPALPLAALALLGGGLLVLPFIWPEIKLLARL